MGSKKNNTHILLSFLVFLTFIPGTVLGANAVLIGDYQIQIFTEPDPLVVEKEANLIIKILRSRDHLPVRNGQIYLNTRRNFQSAKTNDRDLEIISEYKATTEADEFGNYELRTNFKEAGAYHIKVAIKGLEGKTFNKPLIAGFTVRVKTSVSSGFTLLFILSTVFIITLAGGYLIYRRNRIPPVKSTTTRIASGLGFTAIGGKRQGREVPQSSGFNLLEIAWIKGLLQSKFIQPVFQIPLLAAFIILLILAFVDIQDSGKNLSVIVIWTLWWTGIIFTFVLVGRLWCFMCPMGALSEWTSRIFKPRRQFPSKLQNLWLANLFFVLLTWLDIQIGVVRNPVVTGSLLLGITAAAIGIGMRFQRRTFCRYLCPIGGLIGIYAMFSAVELRSKDGDVCRNHKRKDCYLGNKRGYGCPMFETIPKMDSNNVCNFCGECIKSCPKNNITIRVRSFFKDAWATPKKSLDEAALAVVLVGVAIFVTGDMLEPWAGWMDSAMKLFPADLLGIEYIYTVEVITKSVLYFSVSLLLIPGLILLASALSNRVVGEENHNGLRRTFIKFGYMFIPIGLSMHLAHNTGHLLNESGGIIPALQRVLNKYTSLPTGEPNWNLAISPLIDPVYLYWIQMGLFLIFYVFALYAGYRLAIVHYKDHDTSFKAVLPMIVVSFGLMVVNVYLLNLPMAPRHVH
jgi:polyferredoxin